MLITSQATLTVLTSFTDLDESGGFDPYYLLLATNGDLYGSAYGASSGLIFELIKTQSGFSDAPVVVAEGSGSIFPELFAVDGGKLFASSYDPNNGSSGIIEFADTGTSISTTPTVLANFGSDTIVYTPAVDSAGDLFGIENSFTTIDEGRLGIFDIDSSVSTLYEIEKTPNGFGQSVNLGTVDGLGGGLLVDSQGDVFISTFPALDFSIGTIYELQKTAADYASTPTVVVAFDGIDGSFPSGVVEDTNGDLFGTTLFGGQGGKANR